MPMPTKKPQPKSLKGRDLFGGDVRKIVRIKLAELQPNPHQPRKSFDDASIAELAQSITTNGLLQPINVQTNPKGGWFIVSGERRVRAHRLLKKTEIDAIPTEGDLEVLALIENLQREDLDPFEEAAGLALLRKRAEFNTDSKLAKAVGKDRTTINKVLKINTLPDAIRAEQGSGLLSTEHLVLLASLPNSQQMPFFKRMKAGMTVREAKEAKRRVTGKKKATSPKVALKTGQAFLEQIQGLSFEGATELNSKLDALLTEITEVIAGLKPEPEKKTLSKRGTRKKN